LLYHPLRFGGTSLIIVMLYHQQFTGRDAVSDSLRSLETSSVVNPVTRHYSSATQLITA